MEALTEFQVAPLTIYDVAKEVDREMVMDDVKVLKKSGTLINSPERYD